MVQDEKRYEWFYQIQSSFSVFNCRIKTTCGSDYPVNIIFDTYLIDIAWSFLEIENEAWIHIFLMIKQLRCLGTEK